jgi:hypothetical protein
MEMLSCPKKLKSMCFLLSGLLIIMAACATSPAPKQTQAKPTLVITPPSGKARTAITIEGSGFQPQEEVDIVLIAGHLRHSLGTRKVDVIKAGGAWSRSNFKSPSNCPAGIRYPRIPSPAKAGEKFTESLITAQYDSYLWATLSLKLRERVRGRVFST